MKIQTLNRLRQLRDKFRPGQFGKIAQKLLALSFREIGYTHIVERGVQGVDIDIREEGGKKFGLEVKTTDELSISLSADNIQALHDRAKDGYSCVVAVLRLAVFEKWILAKVPLAELSAGQIPIDSLRGYRMRDLENELTPAFERVVEQHFHETLSHGEHYLKEQLKKIGIEARDF